VRSWRAECQGVCKAITVLLSIAAGLLMGMHQADTQILGWNIIRPTNCYEFGTAQNGQISDTLWVYTNTFTVTLSDPAAIHAALVPCYSGWPFWAYNFGGNNWAAAIWINTGQR
jgi:hypothetical protein